MNLIVFKNGQHSQVQASFSDSVPLRLSMEIKRPLTVLERKLFVPWDVAPTITRV